MLKFFLWSLFFIFLAIFSQTLGLWRQDFFSISIAFFIFSFLAIFFEKPILSLPLSLFSGLLLDFHSGLVFLSFTLTLFLLCVLINFSKKLFETKSVIYFLLVFCLSFLFFTFFPFLCGFLLKL